MAARQSRHVHCAAGYIIHAVSAALAFLRFILPSLLLAAVGRFAAAGESFLDGAPASNQAMLLQDLQYSAGAAWAAVLQRVGAAIAFVRRDPCLILTDCEPVQSYQEKAQQVPESSLPAY